MELLVWMCFLFAQLTGIKRLDCVTDCLLVNCDLSILKVVSHAIGDRGNDNNRNA